MRLQRPPMSGYKYSGGAVMIEQLALSDSLGDTFGAIVKRSVLDPIGMTNSTYDQPLVAHAGSKFKDNQELSQARAESVRNFLIKKGVDPAHMVSGGYGPTVPIADNKTKAGREANRRVEFHIVEEEKKEC